MKNEKILVIEDDHKIRAVILTVLEENGYEAFSCSDGKSGIKLAKTIKPLVVVCDIMLPDIDGYQVCKALRESEETQNSIIIFLTAKAEMDDLRKGMEYGADDYLTKPFKTNDLTKAIEVRIAKYKKQFSQVNDNTKELTEESNIFVNLKNETKILKISSIAAISAEGVYTNIWTENGDKFLFRRSVNEWEKSLPSSNFIRTHRAYIVNQEFIEKIEPWFKHSYIVRVKNIDEDFFISERYAAKLKKKFSF